MNHLEASFTGNNHPGRYVVMTGAVLIAANTIGSIPLLLAFTLRAASDPGMGGKIASNPSSLSAMGLDQNVMLALILIPFIAGLITFMLLVRPLHKRSFMSVINGTGNFRWRHFLVSALIWILLSSVYLLLYMKIDPSNFTVNNTTVTLLILSVLAVLLIPFQAALEEILFRGYLMQGFSVLFRNRWLPVAVTSILFGLMHSFNPEVREFGFLTMIPQYVLFGLMFGVVTILDDGIEAAIGAHAANNAFLSIMVTNESSALQTSALLEQQNYYPWTEFTGLLIMSVIFILILNRIFRWNNFPVLFRKIGA
jgi:membrane protease YdiL (CAAX protease family)